MNIFANIVRLGDFAYEKVQYYSVHFEDRELDEFYDFLNRMEDIREIENDLSNLLVWIEEIGRECGAIKSKFRNESITADVYAFPPPKKQMEVQGIIVRDLRLYCFIANEHVVFLFNGGVKTTDNAKDCPNVSGYLYEANDLAQNIEELFRSRDIEWNEDLTDIVFEPSIQIEI